jgi:hypothetical protein
MPIAPDVDGVKAYLGAGHSFTDDEIQASLDSEAVAQSRVCRVPGGAEDPYPADLATALCRRVARALQMKSAPLGYQAGLDGGMSYISSNDPEVRRLEGPFRKRPIR